MLIGDILRKFNAYHLVRYWPPFEFFWKRFHKHVYDAIADEKRRYCEFLGGQKISLAFDIGANVGNIVAIFDSISERTVAVEPDERCFSILKMRYGSSPKIVLRRSAVGRSLGTVEFGVFEVSSVFNSAATKFKEMMKERGMQAQTVTVPCTTLDALIVEHGIPNFLKVDVEGFEVEVFAGLSQPISFVIFEGNLPQFAEETCQVIDKLQALSPHYRFNMQQNAAEQPSWLLENFVSASELMTYVRSAETGSYNIFAKLPS